MCGIAGTFRSGDDVEVMLDRIAHRGPDGRGIWSDSDIMLGHVRLAVQDTDDRAAQPMTVDGVTVAYNGEVWDPDSLRARWPGREWATTSDTEPLAALIAAEGPDGLNDIDGMFAVAWAGPGGRWLARDRWGKVPLYASRRGGEWVFASEIKAFDRGVRAAPVPVGCAVHMDSGRVHRWARPVPPGPLDPATILGLLSSGIARRLVGDRPVCFLCSGGLDSTLVLALARQAHPDPVAYTAVLDPSSPDLAAARRVCAELEVPLVEVKVPEVTRESLGDAVAAVEVPMKAQVEIAVANLPLAKAVASDGFRVALSGEAADELFCGYGNMALAASRMTGDDGYRRIVTEAVAKMGRGNFARVNKVFMAAGVEARLPFMEERLVASCLTAGRSENPPGKRALKDAARGVVPDWVISRQKETFQGGTGTAAAAAALVASPVRFYHAEASRRFGWLPKE